MRLWSEAGGQGSGVRWKQFLGLAERSEEEIEAGFEHEGEAARDTAALGREGKEKGREGDRRERDRGGERERASERE